MRAERVWASDPKQPITTPMPPEGSNLFFQLVKGDIAHPYGEGNWYPPHKPFSKLFRSFTKIPLPFLSWRIGRWHGYLGAKVWGIDDIERPDEELKAYYGENWETLATMPRYRKWLDKCDVHTGATAIHCSVRNPLSLLFLIVPIALIIYACVV